MHAGRQVLGSRQQTRQGRDSKYNTAAERGDFAHCTGEGGLSRYHREPGGDLIWQIGTGYFGCRTADGNFDPEMFREQATLEQVKMIELKLSQGAKPGHGGILPAAKVTPEIAEARRVPVGEDCDSPPGHRAFSSYGPSSAQRLLMSTDGYSLPGLP